MRIYLDFDGVLHPFVKGFEPFEHCHLIEQVLREFPAVQVYVSSAWRTYYKFSMLQSWFEADVRHQIVGVTPYLPEKLRVEEIELHLEQTAYSGPFVVLDDLAEQFPPNYPPLILCQSDRGITHVEIAELRRRLASHMQGGGHQNLTGPDDGAC